MESERSERLINWMRGNKMIKNRERRKERNIKVEMKEERTNEKQRK